MLENKQCTKEVESSVLIGKLDDIILRLQGLQSNAREKLSQIAQPIALESPTVSNDAKNPNQPPEYFVLVFGKTRTITELIDDIQDLIRRVEF